MIETLVAEVLEDDPLGVDAGADRGVEDDEIDRVRLAGIGRRRDPVARVIDTLEGLLDGDRVVGRPDDVIPHEIEGDVHLLLVAVANGVEPTAILLVLAIDLIRVGEVAFTDADLDLVRLEGDDLVIGRGDDQTRREGDRRRVAARLRMVDDLVDGFITGHGKGRAIGDDARDRVDGHRCGCRGVAARVVHRSGIGIAVHDEELSLLEVNNVVWRRQG